ncbi:MAG TPA: hypothetical protein VLH19_03455 [Patescibacteria group bacterium]|nr:hypothetical protein [Patescibacteria group bacterium]
MPSNLLGVVLLLVPVLVLLAATFLYRFSGKKQLMRLDLVQFLFAFIVYPLAYIWLKNFTYFLVRRELGINVSQTEWLVIDTGMSVLFMYFYAFGIIHSLTKTFSLNLERDPLFDLVEHSEYFHEFLSHVGMYGFVLGAFNVLSIINVFVPLPLQFTKPIFYSILLVGICMGLLGYYVMFSVTQIKDRRYQRYMRVGVGLGFIVHAAIYFLGDVHFASQFVVYWYDFFVFSTMIAAFFFIAPFRRIGKRLSRFKNQESDLDLPDEV